MPNTQQMFDPGIGALQAAQQAQMLSSVGKVMALNQNPRAFSANKVSEIIAMAQQLGLDTSQAKSRDKASFAEQVGAGLGGAADAFLLGLIPDSWYSNYRTQKGKSVGKVAGTIASFLVPGLGATRATKLLFGAGKHGFRAAKTAYGVTKAANVASGTTGVKDAAALAKAIFGAGSKGLVSGVKAAHKTAGTLALANALVRAMQLSGNVTQATNPSQYGVPSPYDSVGGMPVMR